MAGNAVALSNEWEQIKARLTTKVPPRAYNDWVLRTVFEKSEGTWLRVSVPDQVTKEWMEQEYAEDIRQAIHELKLPFDRVVYTPRGMDTSLANGEGAPDPVFAAP